MDEKIGVYICECGPNIGDKIDIDRLIKSISSGENVVVDRHKLLCSAGGKEFLKERIKKDALTHLVIGACSPKQHEATFMKVCEDAGLNPYLFQMINIREQCAWVTDNKAEATEKAERLIISGIERVRRQAPLEKEVVERNPDVLVIGGGIAGIETSQMLASDSRKVYLIEKTSELGGKVNGFKSVFPDMKDGSRLIIEKVNDISNNDNVVLFTNAEVEKVRGFFGNFVVDIKQKDRDVELKTVDVGVIVVAIGSDIYDPADDQKYGYVKDKLSNVITAPEFEEINQRG